MCLGFEAVQTPEQPLSKSSKESLGRHRCELQPTGPEPKDPPPESHLWNFLQEDSDSLSASACFCHFSEGVPWISVGSWDKPLPGMLLLGVLNSTLKWKRISREAIGYRPRISAGPVPGDGGPGLV